MTKIKTLLAVIVIGGIYSAGVQALDFEREMAKQENNIKLKIGNPQVHQDQTKNIKNDVQVSLIPKKGKK